MEVVLYDNGSTGLVDNETKGEILSKEKPLTLDETIAFVEARETRQRSLADLGNLGLADQQVRAVKDVSESQCWRCGEKGHTQGGSRQQTSPAISARKLAIMQSFAKPEISAMGSM